MRLDYVIAAQLGRWLRKVGISSKSITDRYIADCRRVGDGEKLEPRDLDHAMACASAIWMIVGIIAAVLAFVFLVSVGAIIGHSSMRGAWLLFPGVWVSVTIFAISNYGFALVRSMYIPPNTPSNSARSDRQAVTSSHAAPKVYDSVVGMSAAAIALLLFAAQS